MSLLHSCPPTCAPSLREGCRKAGFSSGPELRPLVPACPGRRRSASPAADEATTRVAWPAGLESPHGPGWPPTRWAGRARADHLERRRGSRWRALPGRDRAGAPSPRQHRLAAAATPRRGHPSSASGATLAGCAASCWPSPRACHGLDASACSSRTTTCSSQPARRSTSRTPCPSFPWVPSAMPSACTSSTGSSRRACVFVPDPGTVAGSEPPTHPPGVLVVRLLDEGVRRLPGQQPGPVPADSHSDQPFTDEDEDQRFAGRAGRRPWRHPASRPSSATGGENRSTRSPTEPERPADAPSSRSAHVPRQSLLDGLHCDQDGATRRERTRHRADQHPDEVLGLDGRPTRRVAEQPHERTGRQESQAPRARPERVDGGAVVLEIASHAVNLCEPASRGGHFEECARQRHGRTLLDSGAGADTAAVGVRNYLVEGVSGTGKTSVCRELNRRGYHAINGDRDLAYQGDPETGEATDSAVHEHHIWDVGRVQALAADQHEPVTFFCGGSRNFASSSICSTRSSSSTSISTPCTGGLTSGRETSGARSHLSAISSSACTRRRRTSPASAS